MISGMDLGVAGWPAPTNATRLRSLGMCVQGQRKILVPAALGALRACLHSLTRRKATVPVERRPTFRRTRTSSSS